MLRGDLREALAWYEQYVPLVRDTENGVARLLILASAAEALLSAPDGSTICLGNT